MLNWTNRLLWKFPLFPPHGTRTRVFQRVGLGSLPIRPYWHCLLRVRVQWFLCCSISYTFPMGPRILYYRYTQPIAFIWMLPYTVLYLPFSYTHLYVAIRGYTGSTSIPCYSNIWAIPSYVCLYTAIWIKLYTVLYLPFSYTCLDHPILVCSLYGSYAILLYTFPYTMRRYSSPIPSVVHTAL